MPSLSARASILLGRLRQKQKAITASATLLPGDAGTILVSLVSSAVVTLPAAAVAGKGARFTIISVLAPSSGAGTTVDIPATDTMIGNGFTAAAGKGAVCTQATSRAGDAITVESDGVSAWYIIGVVGTWAREA